MVTDIFLDWESYQFRTEEIDAVFHGVVWPQVNLDACLLPRCCLLSPLLLLYPHSLPPAQMLILAFSVMSSRSLFLEVLEHFSVLPLPPKAQELVSVV